MAAVGVHAVRERMAEACRRSDRPVDDVDLLVVSKGRTRREILAVYDAGERLFGENREQGLAARLGEDLPTDIVWHFVGPLQSRKVKSVGRMCSLLHSLDRMKVARLWAQHAPDVPVLAEFNLASEAQKSGFDPRDADRVLDQLGDAGLTVRGVMAIPPQVDDPEDVRPWFAQLRSIFDRWGDRSDGITVCSMGMSNDFEVAIEEGATIVRVGRAIFADEATGRNDRQDG